MAADSLRLNSSSPVAGLGTSTYNVLADGIYSVNVQSTLPYTSGSSYYSSDTMPVDSALQIVINKNGSAQVTVGGATGNPTPSQPILSAGAKLQCVATDVITVVLSSSAAIDAQPNSVKSVINLFQGE